MYLQNLYSKLPAKFISNREFCYLIDPDYRPEDFNPETAEDWIFSRTGIHTRAYLNPEKVGSGLSLPEEEVEFAAEALKKQMTAQEWSEIDAVVSIRSSPYHFIPSLSQRIIGELNGHFKSADMKFTLDLFQPSTGVLNALALLRQTSFKKVLVLVSEILSPLLNLKDPGTAMLFGDAFACFEITPEKTSASSFEVLAENFLAQADTSGVLQSDQGPESFHMKGPELFRKVIPEFKRSALDLLKSQNLAVSDIQHYLPHQANRRILERAAHAIGFEPEKILSNIERVGNLSSASMLVALETFVTSRRIESNDLILLNACGAGLTSGAALFRKL